MMIWRNLDPKLLGELLVTAAEVFAAKRKSRVNPQSVPTPGALSPQRGDGSALPSSAAAESRLMEPSRHGDASAGDAGHLRQKLRRLFWTTPRNFLVGREIVEQTDHLVSLAFLRPRRTAVIRLIGPGGDGGANDVVVRRLLEIGFEEGRKAEVRHLSPLGGDPIAVRIGWQEVAIRRSEAAFILVEPLFAPSGASYGDGQR